MSGESFTRRRDQWRFDFGGQKTNDTADIFPANKYPAAFNVRGYANHSITVRPGQRQQFVTGSGVRITDISTYAALFTDDLPRILVRDVADAIWLDNATQVGSLTPGGPGAAMIPFRPNASPQPYIYIANGADYQKFGAPNPTVNAAKAGIAEPQSPVEAAPLPQTFVEILSPGGNWNVGGTASAWTSGNRSVDIVVTAINDPVFTSQEVLGRGPVPPRWSVQVSPSIQYQRGEVLYFNGTPALITIVEDVIPPLALSMTVQSIYYLNGPPGVAVVVLQGITSPSKQNNVSNQSGQILDGDAVIAVLRRGALIQIGTETTYVRSVTTGPQKQVCIECFLNNNHVAGESVIGLPTIVVNNVLNAASVASSTPIVGDQGNTESFAVTTGIGTLTTGPVGGGPTGTILARPIVSLNGWGPFAHVGAYELGVNQGFNWGLNSGSTSAYNNPGNAIDGDPNTFASAIGQNTHTYYGCVWTFPATVSQSNMALNILSRVLANGDDGFSITTRSAGIWYSIDNGATWNQIYNQGGQFGGPRLKQWDSIPLPAGQVIQNVQVMAFTDSHDDMVQYVYEINITSGAQALALNTGAFQADDYLHFSINIDNLANLTEVKLQFDVGDGTFKSNYYEYSVRATELAGVAANTVTQLGAVQAVVQETQVNEQAGHQNMNISAPTVAGSSQWSEIWTAISGLTRVGGDATKTLATINAVQVLVNCTGNVNVIVSSICFIGTGQPDIGDIGEPYRYRIIGYSSVTGAKSNPSPDMRYGIMCERQMAQLNLPSVAYDPQIDTIWVYRFGGSILSWRFIGQTPSSSTTFVDIYDDAAAQAGDALDFDNFEPWPSVDVPFSGLATTLIGTIAVINITPPTNVARFLPGNLVRIGGINVYTLRTRPVSLGSNNWQFEFVECASGISPVGNVAVNIYEPEIARQFLPYMWGPDVNGTVFAVGDPLRLGTFYMSKPNEPDSAPNKFNQELCSPSEPLLGGVIIDGLSYVASSSRWWALYPQLENPAQRYAPQQAPLPRGLAAPYGVTTDGRSIYWWAEDGIWSSTEGSLTDADLYTLFPHEGIAGATFTYGTPPLAKTINPPDYSRAGSFRIAYNDNYLYVTYQDSGGIYNCLVYDTRRKAWSVDVYATQVSVFYQVPQQAGTLLTNTALYADLLMADITGHVLSQQVNTNDNGTAISCSVAVFEYDGGDNRAPKQWGDLFIDATVAAAAGLTVTPMSLGVPVGTQSIIPVGNTRQRVPLNVGGVVVSDFLGLFLQWIDNFSTQTQGTTLRIWQISYAIQPARVAGFTTFGTSFTLPGYGHIGWVSLAYVSTAAVTMTITSFDGQSPLPVTLPSTGNQYQKKLFRVSANKGQLFQFAFSSAQPFQIFIDDSDVMIGAWQRQAPYAGVKTFEEPIVDSAPL
jgi:hypothetical protein